MTLMEIIWLAIFIGLFVYWLDAMKAKEIARAEGKRLCEEMAVLILDDTVSLRKVRPRRCAGGHLCFLREYDFEFTSDGEYRYMGEVRLLGKRVIASGLEAYRIS